MKNCFTAFCLALGLAGCLPQNQSSSIQSITDASFKGKKYYFAFNGGDTDSVGPTVFEPMFDAYNLGQVFSRSSGGNYATDITYDTKQVSGEFLLKKLDHYASILQPEDMFIMYTGSHGTKDGLYLGGQVLPYEKIVEKVLKFKAKEVVIFMMACHSGAFSNALTKNYQSYAQWGRAGRTLFALASSQASETSSTFPPDKINDQIPQDPIQVPGNTGSAYGNVLWRALRGDADANSDKKVTLKEVYDFVIRETQSLAKHRPAFAGDFPHNLVMTLVEGANTANQTDASGPNASVANIKALDKRISDLADKIYEVQSRLPFEGEPDGPTSDEEAPDSAGFLVKKVVKAEADAALIQAPSEVIEQSPGFASLLEQTVASLKAVAAKVFEPMNRAELERLTAEFVELKEQRQAAVEALRLEVADALAHRD